MDKAGVQYSRTKRSRTRVFTVHDNLESQNMKYDEIICTILEV